MTEKEKLKNGFWYDANYDVELLRERENAEDLYFEFNSTKPSEKERRDTKKTFTQYEKRCSNSFTFLYRLWL